MLNPTNQPRYLFLLLKLAIMALILFIVVVLIAPPVLAVRDRIFPPLSVHFIGKTDVNLTDFPDLPPASLSSLTYNPKFVSNQQPPEFSFLALANDSKQPRFYRLQMVFDLPEGIKKVKFTDVTFLQDSYQPLELINPKGVALSPRRSLFIADENRVREFDLTTGKMRGLLPLNENYLPLLGDSKLDRGIVNNVGFHGLNIVSEGASADGLDPFRLFTATESALLQDQEIERPNKIRLLHYVIVDKIARIVSEIAYTLNSNSSKLIDLIALRQGGYFLTLEQDQNEAYLFYDFVGDATDTSRIESLKGDLNIIQPMRKKLLFNLTENGINPGNLQGITLGPKLSDGSQSLLLLSDLGAGKSQLILLGIKPFFP
jgi:hypothetical protein